MGFTAANDNLPPVAPAPSLVVVRRFSPCGPCLIEGEFIRSTVRFVVFKEWRGGGDYSGRERRLACDAVHLAPCPSCRDHERSQYPNGYMD